MIEPASLVWRKTNAIRRKKVEKGYGKSSRSRQFHSSTQKTSPCTRVFFMRISWKRGWVKVQMKRVFFISKLKRAAKIRKIAVYRFLISLLPGLHATLLLTSNTKRRAFFLVRRHSETNLLTHTCDVIQFNVNSRLSVHISQLQAVKKRLYCDQIFSGMS